MLRSCLFSVLLLRRSFELVVSHAMEKHDSDSGHSPVGDVEKVAFGVEHTENALDRFPDPDAGKSDAEKAAIVGQGLLRYTGISC